MKRIKKPPAKPERKDKPFTLVLPSVVKRTLRCSSCGAFAHASCDCGASYIAAGKLALEAVKSDPTKSNRVIADDLGIDEGTVRNARLLLGAEFSAGEKRIGRDGKSYPASQSSPKRSGHAPPRGKRHANPAVIDPNVDAGKPDAAEPCFQRLMNDLFAMRLDDDPVRYVGLVSDEVLTVVVGALDKLLNLQAPREQPGAPAATHH